MDIREMAIDEQLEWPSIRTPLPLDIGSGPVEEPVPVPDVQQCSVAPSSEAKESASVPRIEAIGALGTLLVRAERDSTETGGASTEAEVTEGGSEETKGAEGGSAVAEGGPGAERAERCALSGIEKVRVEECDAERKPEETEMQELLVIDGETVVDDMMMAACFANYDAATLQRVMGYDDQAQVIKLARPMEPEDVTDFSDEEPLEDIKTLQEKVSATEDDEDDSRLQTQEESKSGQLFAFAPVTIQGLPEYVPEGIELQRAGQVVSVVEGTVLIQGNLENPPLDLGSVLCEANRQILGPVSDTFGPVAQPFYVVCLDGRAASSIAAGTDIFADTANSSYLTEGGVIPDYLKDPFALGAASSVDGDESPAENDGEVVESDGPRPKKRPPAPAPGAKALSIARRPAAKAQPRPPGGFRPVVVPPSPPHAADAPGGGVPPPPRHPSRRPAPPPSADVGSRARSPPIVPQPPPLPQGSWDVASSAGGGFGTAPPPGRPFPPWQPARPCGGICTDRWEDGRHRSYAGAPSPHQWGVGYATDNVESSVVHSGPPSDPICTAYWGTQETRRYPNPYYQEQVQSHPQQQSYQSYYAESYHPQPQRSQQPYQSYYQEQQLYQQPTPSAHHPYRQPPHAPPYYTQLPGVPHQPLCSSPQQPVVPHSDMTQFRERQ